MSRKMLSILLASLMVFTLAFAGCSTAPASSAAPSSSGSGSQPASSEPAASEEWVPDKTITLVVGNAAGGGIDTMARTLAPALEEYLGVSVVVENMPGASSGVAAEYVMGQPKDGYTLFACSSSICAFSTTENSDVTYHDMGILAMPFSTHNPAVLVKADSGINTMEDFIAYVKANPTTASTAGVGSTWHVPAALLANTLGCLENVSFIPYDSGKETTLAVARGEVDWSTCGIYQESSEAITSGLVKPLALVGPDSFNLEGYGEVPSILDSVPELAQYADVLGGWRGFGYAKGTPDNVVAKLTEALEFAINSDDFQALLEKNGVADAPILYGADADALYEKSSRIYSWLLYDLGDSPRSPDELNVPRYEG